MWFPKRHKEAFSLKKYQFFVWAVLLQIFVLYKFISFNKTVLFFEFCWFRLTWNITSIG